MTRFNAWTNRHPLLSFAVGWLALLIVVITCVPADGTVGQAVHVVGGRIRNG